MRIAYREDMPTAKIRVSGPKGEREYYGYLETGAGRTLIPERDAVVFLPVADTGTPIIKSASNGLRALAAAPMVHIILLSTFSSLAVLAADPKGYAQI